MHGPTNANKMYLISPFFVAVQRRKYQMYFDQI